MKVMLNWAGAACVAWGLAWGAPAQETLTPQRPTTRPSQPRPTTQQKSSAPRIVLSHDSWDFGTVWQKEQPTCTLTIKNEGDAELQLTEIHSSCGCTVVEAGRRMLPPGQAMEIRVRFDARGRQGKTDSTITISSNDPARPQVAFKITGHVKRVVTMTPLGGLVIRTLETKPGQTGTVRLENQMPEPMRLQLKSNSLPLLDLEIKEITPGRVYEVRGRTNRQMQPGIRRGALLYSTGLEREPQFWIPARVKVLSRVEPVPAAIYVPRQNARASKRIVTIQYYGSEDFRVTGAACSSPEVNVTVGPTRRPHKGSAQLSPAPTAYVTAQVELPPGSELPEEGAVVEFTTNDPEHPKVEVIVTADQALYQRKMFGPPPQAAPKTGR